MSRHVVVFSHRRSGTHLTIDAIRNNFGAYRSPYLNLDLLLNADQGAETMQRLSGSSVEAPLVHKSHSPADIDAFFGDDETGLRVRRLVSSARVIYVHRDGRDVMTSLYHYVRAVKPELSTLSFDAFLRSKDVLGVRPAHDSMTNAEYWRYHVLGWLGRSDVLVVSFESMIRDYEHQIRRLSNFLEEPMPAQVVDVVRSAGRPRSPHSAWSRLREKAYKMYRRLTAGIDLTSVEFRQGRVHAYEEMFSQEQLRYFYDVAGDVLEKLGYETRMASLGRREGSQNDDGSTV